MMRCVRMAVWLGLMLFLDVAYGEDAGVGDDVDEVFTEADVADDVVNGDDEADIVPESETADPEAVTDPPLAVGDSVNEWIIGDESSDESMPDIQKENKERDDSSWGALYNQAAQAAFEDEGASYDEGNSALSSKNEGNVAPHVPCPVTDPCAGVTCSGGGRCTVVSGNPTCACFAGFKPDGIYGLNCLPNYTIHSGSDPFDFQAYYLRLKEATGGFDLDPILASYRIDVDAKRFNGTFVKYLDEYLRQLKKKGIFVFSGGLVGLFSGVFLHVAYGSTRKAPLLAGAVALDVVGATLMGVGGGIMGLNERRLRQVTMFERRNRSSSSDNRTIFQPFVTNDGGGLGVKKHF